MSVRVGITTSPDRLGEMGESFHRAGLEPVSLPCIRVVPLGEDWIRHIREEAEGADLLVLTSWRPLDILWPEGALPPVPVATVGSATARRARERGARVAAEGTGGAEDLVARIEGARAVVVYPHAEGTDQATIRLLEERSRRLVAGPVYRTEPMPPPLDPVTAAAFASPSAVEGWTMSRSLDEVVVAAIGETTAAALEHRGRRADVVPTRPGYAMLAEALAAYFEEAR